MPSSFRRTDIQGLRGVAVLLVVLYHGGFDVPGGFTGVDVFFVISGFVIAGLLLRELESSGSIRLMHFYARRVRRLLPALAVMVALVAVAGVLASPVDGQVIGAHTGIAASLFAANAYLYRLGTGYFDVRTTHDFFLHTWTLGVEEQFYLVFPALLLVSWRLGRGSARVTSLVVAAVSGASLLLALALADAGGLGAHARFAFYGSPARAWEFGAGVLLAVGASRVASIGRRALGVMGVAGLVAVCAGGLLLHGTNSFIGWRMLVPVFGSLALIAAGLGGATPVTHLLATRPLVWIGDRSYSWYLWHWPIIVFAKALFPAAPVAGAAAALSLLPAWLSYRYVENPLRSNPRIQGRRTVALAATCIAVPIAACVGLLAMHNFLFHTSALRRWQAVSQPYLSVSRGCESTTPLGDRAGIRWSRCTWRVAHPRGRIVLVGDSNAAQFTEPVVRGGTQAGYDVTVAPLTGCPFIRLRVFGTGVGESACYGFDSKSLRSLLRHPPSIVVIANRDDLTMGLSRIGFRGPLGVTYDSSVKADLWAQGLGQTLMSLNHAGVRVVLVRPVPLMRVAPSDCAVIRVLTTTCRNSIRRADANAALQAAVSAESKAASGAPMTSVVNLERGLCGVTRCSTIRSGTILYRDADHLSAAGARTLTPAFYRAFAALP